MHDLVIKNAFIIDGTAEPGHHGSVAVSNGNITAVEFGEDTTMGPAREVIDAEGHLLTPGWVDIHTHYDGQATWDPLLTPSSWHGVTTAVFGNCGVGFAPVKPGSEAFLINLMEGVEDIPGTVLAEGIDFSWETFEEYLDVLESRPRIMDIGAQVPHGALRFYVMGERGADPDEPPTETELAAMGRILKSSLEAGALGFTTSRTVKHKTADGRPTPSLSAADRELLALAQAMGEVGRGVIEVNSDLGPGEFERLGELARRSNRPLSVLLLQVDRAPELWAETLDWLGALKREGLAVNGQVGCRPIGILMGFETSVHPFSSHPAWKAMSACSPSERIARLLDDSELRHALVSHRPDDPHTRWMDWALERSFELDGDLDYEPAPQRSITGRAEENKWQLALDIMLKDSGTGLILYPFENYTAGSLDVIREMLVSEHTICGLGDAGAHVATICDASYPTFLLTHWARDRTRGDRIAIEFLVHKQTRATALAYGLRDRGLIAPGYRADLNIIDLENLALEAPSVSYDLPAGGRRLVQRANGYIKTFVNGVCTMSDGAPTGALPGGLVRGSR